MILFAISIIKILQVRQIAMKIVNQTRLETQRTVSPWILGKTPPLPLTPPPLHSPLPPAPHSMTKECLYIKPL